MGGYRPNPSATVNGVAAGFIRSGARRRSSSTLLELLRLRGARVSYFVRDETSFVSGQVVYVAGGPKA
jgi:hypothetical protein